MIPGKRRQSHRWPPIVILRRIPLRIPLRIVRSKWAGARGIATTWFLSKKSKTTVDRRSRLLIEQKFMIQQFITKISN